MNEIKCPNCGEVFTVNESQYAELISQVRTVEFDKELHERMKQELALAEQKAMNEQQTKLAQKDQEIAQLQSQITIIPPIPVINRNVSAWIVVRNILQHVGSRVINAIF